MLNNATDDREPIQGGVVMHWYVALARSSRVPVLWRHDVDAQKHNVELLSIFQTRCLWKKILDPECNVNALNIYQLYA